MIGHSRRGLLGGALALAVAARGARASAAPLPTPAFRRGVNVWPWFSLTREFPAPRTDYDWPPFQEQRPVPTRANLATLRAAGFDFIRIPVDPGPFLAFAGERRTVLLRSLFAAVDDAVSTGLCVVLNVQANEATHYWVSQRMIGSRAAPGYEAYRELVRTIATGLSRFGAGQVALEPVNEPPQQCGSPAWNEVQIDLLSHARAAAPQLTLIATGACGSMVAGLEQLDPTALLKLRPLLFTFHFYEPYLFSHQGAPWMREPIYRWLNDVPWPGTAGSLAQTLAAVRARMAQDADATADFKQATMRQTERVLAEYFAAEPDRSFIRNYFTKVQSWAARYGIPADQIMLGEFGALRTDQRYTASRAADRARYIRDVRETADAFGFPWAFWNLFDGMGLMDDAQRTLDPQVIDALGLTMPRS
jgi:hypothetical protein